MGDKSKIEWCDATWNVIGGCTKVSKGCEHCYALGMSWRMQNNPKAPDRYRGVVEKVDGELRWTGQVNLDHEALEQPLRWTKPRRIFVQSMGDLFHPDVPGTFIDQVMKTVLLAPQHTFMVLTKRARRMFDYFYGENPLDYAPEFPKNLWLGVTAENQARAEERLPWLLQTPAAVRFVSIEPMLGPVTLQGGNVPDNPDGPWPEGPLYDYAYLRGVTGNRRVDLVIVGGETGPEARPMHPDWVRSVRDQCREAGTSFFFKHWGAWLHDSQMSTGQRERARLGAAHENRRVHEWPDGSVSVRIGKKAAGRLLGGREWNETPERQE